MTKPEESFIPGKSPLHEGDPDDIPTALKWDRAQPPRRNTTTRLILVLVLATFVVGVIVWATVTGLGNDDTAPSNPVTTPQ